MTSAIDTSPRPCGMIRRMVVMGYDAMLLFSVIFFAAMAVAPITPYGSHPLFRLYLIAICYLYFAWPWVKGGQTLGMKAWRVRVQQPDGSRITWKQAAIRFVVALLAWLPAGFGYWRALADPQWRAWPDLASGTELVVVPLRPRRKPHNPNDPMA